MKKDILNDWQFCDPDVREDQLPMPYRIIDEVLREEILQNTYNQSTPFYVQSSRSRNTTTTQIMMVTYTSQAILDNLTLTVSQHWLVTPVPIRIWCL